MRMMLRMQMPAAAANAAIADGRFAKLMPEMMERLKPEAAYFGVFEGDRTGFIVFDLQDPSDIPVICEPLFATMNAKVDLQPVMSAEDVQAGLAKAAG